MLNSVTIGVRSIMDRIKKTLKYIALSYKINFTGGSKY